ncbi:MAG: rhomboid family intramembrane serine protease, partial [Planctomycetes bacterium]|nr:rhomboid family intramembrane serine protease [Planctomycetota bacterium]
MMINVIVFMLMLPLSPGGGILGPLIRWLGLSPDMWLVGPPYLPIWQMVTYGFVHDTSGLMHILSNMLALYFFGGLLEQMIGSRRLAIGYFGALFAGGLAHLVAGWIAGSSIPGVGASGAVLGVLIMAAVLQPDARVI